MSNPGVISLSRIENFDYRFEIEDNIGECIHIHFSNIRIDLSISEFELLCQKIETTLNKMYEKKGFNCSEFDEQFLFDFSEEFVNIDKIENDCVQLDDLLIRDYNDSKEQFCRLKESKLYSLVANDDIRDAPINLYSKGENRKVTNKERISFIKNSILEKNNAKPIVLSHDNVILDGKYRSIITLIQNGSVTIPVKRIITNKETICTDKETRIFNSSFFVIQNGKKSNEPFSILPTEKMITGRQVNVPPNTNNIVCSIVEIDNCILYNLTIESNIGHLNYETVNGLKIGNSVFFIERNPVLMIKTQEPIKWIKIITGLSIKSNKDLLDEIKETIERISEESVKRIDESEQKVREMTDSFSWKITRPIRSLYRHLKKH